MIAFGSKARGRQLTLVPVFAPLAFDHQRLPRFKLPDDLVDLGAIRSTLDAQIAIRFDFMENPVLMGPVSRPSPGRARTPYACAEDKNVAGRVESLKFNERSPGIHEPLSAAASFIDESGSRMGIDQ